MRLGLVLGYGNAFRVESGPECWGGGRGYPPPLSSDAYVAEVMIPTTLAPSNPHMHTLRREGAPRKASGRGSHSWCIQCAARFILSLARSERSGPQRTHQGPGHPARNAPSSPDPCEGAALRSAGRPHRGRHTAEPPWQRAGGCDDVRCTAFAGAATPPPFMMPVSWRCHGCSE